MIGGRVYGGPPLMSGTWFALAADRPTYGGSLVLDVVGTTGPCRAVWVPPGKGSYAASFSSAGLPLSIIICSVSLAVYPQTTNWFR